MRWTTRMARHSFLSNGDLDGIVAKTAFADRLRARQDAVQERREL